jgi:hypothetical protein
VLTRDTLETADGVVLARRTDNPKWEDARHKARESVAQWWGEELDRRIAAY